MRGASARIFDVAGFPTVLAKDLVAGMAATGPARRASR